MKAPGGVSRAFAARGRNAVLLPAHVPPGALDAFLRGADAMRSLDGMVATVPRKFAAFRHCATATERARFLGSANALRRNPDGTWHGDMMDGLGFVAGLGAAGLDPAGRRALLVGAGGAGSAIALALAEVGVSSLAVHDADAARRDRLLRTLAERGGAEARAGSPDPAGFDLVVNATPAGMRPEDASPVLADRLEGRTFVADVITAPENTPLLEAARAGLRHADRRRDVRRAGGADRGFPAGGMTRPGRSRSASVHRRIARPKTAGGNARDDRPAHRRRPASRTGRRRSHHAPAVQPAGSVVRLPRGRESEAARGHPRPRHPRDVSDRAGAEPLSPQLPPGPTAAGGG